LQSIVTSKGFATDFQKLAESLLP